MSAKARECEDCGNNIRACCEFECDTKSCGFCDGGSIHPETSQVKCGGCVESEAAYWARYFGASIKTHRNSCEALGLPSDASSSEIMDAARRLK